MIHSGSGRCLAWVETDSGYRHVERRAQRFLNRRPQRGEAATAESDRIGVSAHGRTGENDVA
jgi:hypothetical protein